MSDLPPNDPRLEEAGASDESLLAAHEKLLGRKPDDGAHYKLLPLVLLFVFSGLIFYAGTYLNRYTAHYDAAVFDENGHSASGAQAAVAADPMVLGKRSYEQVCVTCHQSEGQGVPGVYPPLAGSEWVNGAEERVIRIVLYGLKGVVHVKGTEYNAAAMPAVGKVAGSGYNWSDDKIAAVLTYVRGSFGNTSKAITAEQVAAVHAKEGDRKEWSEDELKKIPDNAKSGPNEAKKTPEEAKKSPDEAKKSPDEAKKSPDEGRKSPDEAKKTPEENKTPAEPKKTP